MKPIRIAIAALVGMVLLVSVGATMTIAAGLVGVSPVTAPYIDNQPHTLDGNGSLWFRFDNALDDTSDCPTSTITLVDSNKDNWGFQVWTPDELNDYADSKPIGRGTPYSVDCDTGELSGQGECKSNDVTWTGAFGESGTYFVRVFNDNAAPASAQLLIQGSGASLDLQAEPTPTATVPPTSIPTAAPAPTTAPTASATEVPTSIPTIAIPASPTAAPTPTAVPAANPTPTPLANLDDPNRAAMIDGNVHILAGKSAIWYAFDYALNDDGSRPQRTVTLVGGNNSGVRFEVFAPNVINDWWENKPIGQGTVNMVTCNDSDQTDQTQCQSNDLTWGGAFNAGMRIYVRVVNDNDHPTPFQLTLQ